MSNINKTNKTNSNNNLSLSSITKNAWGGSLSSVSNGYTFNTSISNGTYDAKNTSYGFSVSGDSCFDGATNFNGPVSLNNVDLVKILEKIEERLAILEFNPELEQRWEELRKAREHYLELEQEIKAKEKVWQTIQQSN